MNILMFTNTYLPHVGGVAMSIHRFVEELEASGNRVRVVAPSYLRATRSGDGIYRIPAIHDFNGSGFSLPLPAPWRIADAVRGFTPDIVHSHHPYLLGNSALKYGAFFRVPVVFTHHTLYEHYTHYIPGDSVPLKRFVVRLSVTYANLCHRVIAPSPSMASILKYRGVNRPVSVIPTGVDRERFSRGSRELFRQRFGIPGHAFVVGHVGRLAKEKNIEYLTLALSRYLKANPSDHVLIAGRGPMEGHMMQAFARRGLDAQVHLTGVLNEQDLPDAYRAMDVFAFTSQTETQGLVILEALASGLPVVALDGPGVRDVVEDGMNGRLIRGTDLFDFVHALIWVKSLDIVSRKEMDSSMGKTVNRFTMKGTADDLLSLYSLALSEYAGSDVPQRGCKRMAHAQSHLIGNNLSSLVHALAPASRELHTCGPDFPQDTELQDLLAQHAHVPARILGYSISLALRLLKSSWRTRAEGIDHIKVRLSNGEPVLLSFWHNKYAPLFALFEGLHCCIFASCSFRGEVISEICRRFGYECILIPEGERKRSVQIMAKSILHYGAGAVAADGPRGPRHVFKPGSVQLASDLGLTVVPVSMAASSKLVSKRRWDRFEVPLPRSRVAALVGEGIAVPVGIKAGELEFWSRRLEAELDSADIRAEALLALEGRERNSGITQE